MGDQPHMPDKREGNRDKRGAHQGDRETFARLAFPALTEATIAAVLQRAEQRDQHAEQRDRAADNRDADADADDNDTQHAQAQRQLSALDRIISGQDRDEAATDRAELIAILRTLTELLPEQPRVDPRPPDHEGS